MSGQSFNAMIDGAIERIREVMNTNTVIGDPITLPNGTTAVPVCRVTFGFGSGGSDLPNKSGKEMFGGGMGTGVSVTPIAFLVSTKDGAKLLQLDTIGTTADNIVRSVPDVLDKISGIINEKKQ